MTTQWIAWCVSGMLGLVCVAFSLITYVPSPTAERERIITQVASATGALAFAALGLVSGQLPAQHWLNRSRAFRGLLLSFAIVCALFLALIL